MTKFAILIIIVLIVAVGLYSELQRGNNLAATAKRLGLEYSPGLQPVPSALSEIDFDLLAQGGHEIANRMTGHLGEYPVEIFDYSYDAPPAREGFGSHPAADEQINVERRNQTAIRLQVATAYPDFDISPAKGPMRQVAARYQFVPLVLEHNREFSRAYHLLVRDRERCRVLFDQQVQAFFLKRPDLVVEGRGRELLFYRLGRRLKAKEIAAFLQESQTLAGLFENALTTAE